MMNSTKYDFIGFLEQVSKEEEPFESVVFESVAVTLRDAGIYGKLTNMLIVADGCNEDDDEGQAYLYYKTIYQNRYANIQMKSVGEVRQGSADAASVELIQILKNYNKDYTDRLVQESITLSSYGLHWGIFGFIAGGVSLALTIYQLYI